MCIELVATVLLSLPTVIGDEIPVTAAGHSYAPDMVCAPDGTFWLTWKSYDPVEDQTSILLKSCKNEILSNEVCIAAASGDIISPKIAIDRNMGVWVTWAESREGGWDIYARTLNDNQISEEIRITEDGRSFRPAIVPSPDGDIWITWQSKQDGNFKIFTKRYRDGEWSTDFCISENQSSNRQPAIVADSKGNIWIAWDTFKNGNYDIYIRHTSDNAGGWSEPIRVTASMEYDMEPSLDTDSEGRIWIAWTRCPVWGEKHYRLNIGKRVMLRGYEPKTGKFVQPQVSNRDLDGMAIIPVDTRGRVVPITPTVVIGKDDIIHILYRQFRDKGSNDWGWNTALMSYCGSEWSDVQQLSNSPGFPISEIGAALDDLGHLWATYQSCDFAGGRKPLVDADSNIYLRRFSSESIKKPILAAAVMLDSKHLEEFEIPRPDPGRRKSVEIGSEKYQLLWGDTHRHSTQSKCVPERDGTLWDHYRWAQDIAELDFYSITDHTEQTSDWEARKGRIWSDLFYSEPDFISIFGYEQNFRDTEHTNFFYIDRSIGQFVREVRHSNVDLPDAIKMLDESDMQGKVLIARHFHGDGFGKKYETAPPIYPDYEWVIEAVQTRGFSPITVGHYLSSGAMVGLMGGSDHSRSPGGRGGPWVYPYALTGLWVKEPSREGVFAALKERRCYATNSKKIYVEFSSDDHFMGSEYETSSAPILKIRAVGTTVLYRVELIRNKEVILSKNCEGQAMELEYIDHDIQPGRSYYYVKIVQGRQGNDNYRGMAITSPIWITLDDM